MDEEYDVIVLGTGLKECILSGLLSSQGRKVLHMDRNGYYGGESASLKLEQLYEQFEPGHSGPIPESLGRSRDYSIDTCPKFIMACGDLVKLLLHSKVTHYLEFQSVQGSYVFKDGSIYKVPATSKEALETSLMGIFQKRRFKNFLEFAESVDTKREDTVWNGLDLRTTTMREVYKHYKLDDNTAAFTGHALALQHNDAYMDDASQTLPTLDKIQLYAYSVARYGNSPYIYPLWGLGGLPEGFARRAAINGSTYMLNAKLEEIVYADSGEAVAVRVHVPDDEEQIATVRTKMIIADPSYFPEKCQKTGTIARWLFILNHPIPNTRDSSSCQIIIPAKHAHRQHDVYIACVSAAHRVAPDGKWIAMLSTVVETDNPKAELRIGVDLLGETEKDFFFTTDSFAPSDSLPANVYVSSSYDATSHFESTSVEAQAMWERITGSKLDMSISADPEDLQDA